MTYQSLTSDVKIPAHPGSGCLKSCTYTCFLTRTVRKALFFSPGWGKWEPAGKPGSVVGNHSSGMRVAVHLERPTRKHALAARRGFRRMLPYLALLPAGFAVPSPLPSTRCALTAPFQPCRRACARLGGVLSVALSVGSRPPGVTWRRAMRSPDFPPRPRGRSGCLADSRLHLRTGRPAPQVAASSSPRVSTSARA